ncbi:MAG: hypothetical protein JKY89_00380 [Immundisolibacteraceae bacterium]|nr:hypothetical protein [Immundisolibacteraceae bacterium]
MTSTVSETEYRELSNFLFAEADLLSDHNYVEWEKLLAEDLHYKIPIPQFLEQKGARQIGTIGTDNYNDNIDSMRIRLNLLKNPATTTSERVRSLLNHVVGNVLVSKVSDNEYECKSTITVHRTRFNQKHPTTISGRRTDLIRRTDIGFQLVKRHVKLTQAILMTSNVSYFF